MKRPDDPLRLIEDPNAPSPLAEAVRAARGPAPDKARLESLALSLGLPAPLLPPPVVPPVAGAAGAGAAGAAGMTAGAGGVKLAVTGLAAATLVGAVAVVAAVSLSAGRHRAAVTAPAAVVEKLERRAPEPLENEPEIPILEPPAPAAASAATPHRRHPARSAPAAVVEAPAAPVETPSDAASRLREEAALVQSAERLLASDPAGALRLTEERRRRFPRGALDQEAEVVAIDALLRLGRRPDATTRAHAFEAAHAGSLHARRIKRLLGE